MNFDSVEKIAAAILYEGYILYPYRPSAIKNRQRWNFGTLYPRVYAEAQRPAETWRLVSECVVVAGTDAQIDVKVNFLQLLRGVQRESADAVNDLRGLSDPSLEWDEAVERSAQCADISLGDLLDSPSVFDLQIDAPAVPAGRDGLTTSELSAVLVVSAEAIEGGLYRLRIELQNETAVRGGAGAKRDEALPLSFVSAHLLLGVTDSEFVSLLDPAEMHREAVAGCSNIGVFPVLAGDEPDRSRMLCSPIILYDYPKIAPESAGDFFDGTEMDEMLTLRVLTLTDAEKEEMRAGDPRARRILERTEALTGEEMLKAHGIIRGLREIRGNGL